MISFNHILYKLTNWHNDNYIKLFVEPFSIPLAWLAINFTRLSANQVTLMGFFLGVLGNFLGWIVHPVFIPLGFFAFFIIDFVDGKVARARGGGTPQGKRLDVLVDRAIFCFTVFSLTLYHFSEDENKPVVFLMAYTLAYFYTDIMEYSAVIMTHDGVVIAPPTREKNLIKIFYSFSYWIPTRLSSPLFILFGYLFTQNFVVAYLSGLSAVVLKQLIIRLPVGSYKTSLKSRLPAFFQSNSNRPLNPSQASHSE